MTKNSYELRSYSAIPVVGLMEYMERQRGHTSRNREETNFIGRRFAFLLAYNLAIGSKSLIDAAATLGQTLEKILN